MSNSQERFFDLLTDTILANVEETLNDMIAGSNILDGAGRRGEVTFVGAYYELTSGKVHFSQPVDLAGAPAPTRTTHPSDHTSKGTRH